MQTLIARLWTETACIDILRFAKRFAACLRCLLFSFIKILTCHIFPWTFMYWQCKCLKASCVWLSINLPALFLPADSIGPGQRDWDPVQYNRSGSRPASQWRLHHRPCDRQNVCHQTSGQRGKSILSCKCCLVYTLQKGLSYLVFFSFQVYYI